MSLRVFRGWNIFGRSGKKRGEGRKIIERDERFLVTSPLLYRPAGTLSWFKGTIDNVSPSGVLFQAEKLVPVACPIEMTFSLPAEKGSHRKIQIFCWGKVTRTVMPPAGDGPLSLAAKITRYRAEGHKDPKIQFRTAA